MQQRRRNRGHLDMQINTVEQGAGCLALITPYLFFVATTPARRITKIATRTGVHCRHQLKPGRKGDAALRTTDHNSATFQRLSQYIQHLAAVFWQFVQKQYSGMCQ